MDAQHKEIQTLFIDGVNEVFYTLFNDGVNEGVYFFPQVKQSENIYHEVKGKIYGNPALLVSRVQLDRGYDSDLKKSVVRSTATFTVPYKSLVKANGIDMSEGNYPELQKGLMKYKDSYFTIDKIQPHAFVEQVFLLYDFICTEVLYSDLEDIEFLLTEDFEETVGVSVEEEVIK